MAAIILSITGYMQLVKMPLLSYGLITYFICFCNAAHKHMFVTFLYFLLFYNDFLLLGKMYIFSQ